MTARLSLAALGGAISDLPDAMKIVSGVFIVAPLVFALVGTGWAGMKVPAKIDAHIAQSDSIRKERAVVDSAMLSELREGNRLAKCALKFQSYTGRLNCAVTP